MKTAAKAMVAAAVLIVAVGPATAQRVPITTTDRYPAEEVSSGYYDERESVLPGAYQLYLQTPQSLGAFWGTGPRAAGIDRRSFAADAHAAERGYSPVRDCLDCHQGLERNLHSARTTVTCRQCHEDEPIAGVFHYYSELNPIRRHAYVCAKCHQGATANFAAYVVHEPNPVSGETRGSFPALFYVVWVMLILAGGVFVFFIPYTLAWGVRELIELLQRKEGHSHGSA